MFYSINICESTPDAQLRKCIQENTDSLLMNFRVWSNNKDQCWTPDSYGMIQLLNQLLFNSVHKHSCDRGTLFTGEKADAQRGLKTCLHHMVHLHLGHLCVQVLGLKEEMLPDRHGAQQQIQNAAWRQLLIGRTHVEQEDPWLVYMKQKPSDCLWLCAPKIPGRSLSYAWLHVKSKSQTLVSFLCLDHSYDIGLQSLRACIPHCNVMGLQRTGEIILSTQSRYACVQGMSARQPNRQDP